MAATHKTKVYGLNDAKIYALTADASGGSTSYGSAIDVPGISKIGLAPQSKSTMLRGDDVVLDVEAELETVNFTVEHAILDLDVLAALTGASVVDSGSTTSEVATLSFGNTTRFGYFQLKGALKGVDDTTGNALLVLYKAKLTNLMPLDAAQKEYASGGAFKLEGVAIGRRSDGKLWDIVYNETAVSLS